ncbi:AraC-like DNA-binding protein/mannose-6-phosphate isomerase-like protein (cupin superfamily) [Paenibacillus sp. V4I3]|uniref:AraC family transcriptional regulator n=1 Tax=Paenibacillus sp. V4I3 TaxID=3042305 RepID=UPI00278BAA33|nr:helix-turn-helix domain-containing protein [Paenibacillus sp. V4I3]MDQ0877824.1 AraC-like DNA-binding protein/mannose-6-phosphate isomerase-like protein (cupin superfamily) [Paenibacillus sp. V4I3]
MDYTRKPEGFEEQKLFVLPDYMQTELSSSELTRDLFISDIGFFPNARHHYRERREGSSSYIFIFCSDGEGWIELGQQKAFALTQNHLAVIPAKTPHRYGASSHAPWSIYWFHLQGDHVAAFIRLYGMDTGPVHLPIGALSEFKYVFDKCYVLLSDKTYSLPIHTHVSQSIRHLISGIGISAGGTAKDKKREQYLELAIRYMNDRLEDSIKLPELAKHTGLSKQHLILLFKEETGFPPIEYFLRMKIQKAAQMLSLTGQSIKEVAANIGITDPYYFSRLFKKMTGSSPTAYRSVPKG